MVDVHTHILPGMDDGSGSVEESLEMLSALYTQGANTVVLSPHFYSDREALPHFLERRADSFRALQDAMSSFGEPLPRALLGAEVWYFDGMSRASALKALCIEGTDLLLLEMPFERWSDSDLQEILRLQESSEFTVLLAHIDRYLPWQKARTWESLLEHGVRMQANASCFTERRSSRKALRLFRDGQIHLLGSDAHNLTSRPPDIGQAIAQLRQAFGDEALRLLRDNERWLGLAAEVLI